MSESNTAAKQAELRFSAGTYLKRDISVVRGEGVFIYDEDGKKYYDCIAGIGTASLGHAHPKLVEAISKQAETLISVQELLCNPVRAAYQEAFLKKLPDSFERVFLCNSGTEAVEAALKFARFSTGNHGILALKRGYHGKTLGALAATAEQKYREPFAPLLPEAHHVSASNIEEVREIFRKSEAGEIARIGCYILETIQGEGGIQELTNDFIVESVAIAQKHQALVIIDEVQTGCGRTGKMWSFEHFDIEPDIVCAAKGIAGGVPIGAVAIGSNVAELPPLGHTSTFGGNPLACRAGLTVLETLEQEQLIRNAASVGELIKNELEAAGLKRVRNIRGKGLMIGIELKERAGKYLELLANEGLLCLLAGPRVIRLLPPLTLKETEAREICSILVKVLSK